MNRRSFFGKLFGRSKPDDMVFFGVQVVFNAFGIEGLRKDLHHILAESEKDELPEEKKRFYKKFISKLLEAKPYFEYGYWDYLPEEDDAEAEFQDWTTGIEANLATEEEELGEKADELSRFSSHQYYVVVSLCFLLEVTPELDRFLTEIDIKEQDLFRRDTFAAILHAINYIDFEFAVADAVYIVPGNEEDGFSQDDILSEGWQYLKPVES
ncbi:MAG: hypothetical protein SFU91_13220 [Chloroherpetonaceae bacterium]|nr:hypothetical protein [Chloroherpetonaceae bacterium]